MLAIAHFVFGKQITVFIFKCTEKLGLT